MKCAVIGGEIVDVHAPHVRLDRRKDVRNVDSQFFTFVPVHREVVIRCMGGVKAVRAGNRGIRVRLTDEPLYHPFEGMHIVIGIALLYLETEADN